MKSNHVLYLCSILLLAKSTFGELLVPPPLPEIPPIISESYSSDLNGDKISDELQDHKVEVSTTKLLASTEMEQDRRQMALNKLVDVELIFKEQITQQQIDYFLRLGGKISYIYQAVSYGWQGRIPNEFVDSLPLLMGDSLVLIKGPKYMELDMDVATQTGRVRPIWKSGFGSNNLGFNGDPNITIGIIDSGVDGTHMDLVGRKAYWLDCSDDNEPKPVDYHGHGSHLAGIILGSGNAGGRNSRTFYYTNTKRSARESYIPGNIALNTNCQFSIEARWNGPTYGKLSLIAQRLGTIDDVKIIRDNSWDMSPITLSLNLSPQTGYVYFPLLQGQNEGDQLSNVVITSSVTNYPGAKDDFNKFCGVAPECRWAAAKTQRRDGKTAYGDSCKDFWICRAIDDFVSNSHTYGIKVINMCLGNPFDDGDIVLIDQINTAVNNGIVFVLSAGNDGKENDLSLRAIRGFKYAAKAITVGGSNDKNALASYSSHGLGAPMNESEDYKPDLIAPGGSEYYTGLISVDSGTNDGDSIPDTQANDYAIRQGTSMSAPFVAGCAALVIDAIQQEGAVWDFQSDSQPKYVKMLLCATATETAIPREDGAYSDELKPQRSAWGPNSFPRGKDPYEGYGIINADAAVEAVALDYIWGNEEKETFGSNPYDRRAWARKLTLEPDASYKIELTNPSTGDFDLYVYDAEPSATGTPVYLAEPSTNVGEGGVEIILLDGATQNSSGGSDQTGSNPNIPDLSRDLIIGPSSPNPASNIETTECILVVKRVSGYGEFTLRGVRTDFYGSIVGKWSLQSEGRDFFLSNTSGIYFDSDGTFTETYYTRGFDLGYEEVTRTGTWDQLGNSVWWTEGDDSTPFGYSYEGILTSETTMSGTWRSPGQTIKTWEATKLEPVPTPLPPSPTPTPLPPPNTPDPPTGDINIHGYVRTNTGIGVPGVTVTFIGDNGSKSTTTDSSGHYSFFIPAEWLPAPLTSLNAFKEGYQFEPIFSDTSFDFITEEL